MQQLEVMSRAQGGSALARDAVCGELTRWYGAVPAGVAGWSRAAGDLAREFAGRDWLSPLEPAIRPTGPAAVRLRECAAAGGVVVTTGQQPGLFGGPLYVLYKALTALAICDELERTTGVRTAPLFWAATDDTDLAEADHVGVVTRGEVQMLSSAPPEGVSVSSGSTEYGVYSASGGIALATAPLGAVDRALQQLAEACGSAADPTPLVAVQRAYSAPATVGSAYVNVLRELLEPLGVAVLDAAHPAVRMAASPLLQLALERAASVSDALRRRSAEIRGAGYRPQVSDVPRLSLVFRTDGDGARRRVLVQDAASVAGAGESTSLGPNVLLRPLAERSIVPTVAYAGGPGEMAYFAQVSAVAEALGAAAPRIVPRWSGIVLEPHVQSVLADLGASVTDFQDPHAMEGRVARRGVPQTVRAALADIAESVERNAQIMRSESGRSQPLVRSVESMRRSVEHRLARLERRYAAAVKQAGSRELREVALARASLFPLGKPQERVLSFVPFLARYGSGMVDACLAACGAHARDLVRG